MRAVGPRVYRARALAPAAGAVPPRIPAQGSARKRLPDDRPGAAANKEICRLLDFTFPFIGRFDDRDLRGELTREDREVIIDTLWQSMDELGHLAQRVRNIDLEQTTERSINDRPSAPRAHVKNVAGAA